MCAQGRNGNWQDVQTVIEIATEAPFGDLLFEIAVRRRDHADVDANVLSPADPLERFLLEKAQQLRLQRRYHLADLVEKDGAPIRRLQQSTFLQPRIGERAPLVAEEFALEQLFRQR